MDSEQDHEVRQLAYELWREADQPNGEALRFWLQAEQRVLKERNAKEEALEQGLEDSFPASDPPSEVQRSSEEK